jgi:SNF2 family DNA or RNA helicase
MLRRQKSTVIDGKPICVIPPKHIHHHNVVLSPYELAFYKEIETKGQAVINRFLMRTSPAKYSTVLLFLLRLRQTCCHTHLITHLTSEDFTPAISEEDLITYAKKLDEDVIGRLREHFDAECPICFDVAVNATIFIPCGHGCCGECTSKLFDENARGQDPTCPQCRGPLNRQSITDYKHFCQVHCPDQWEGHTDVNGRFSQGIDNDDHDSDDSDGDEVDDSGNLAGFVVPDDSEGENRRTDRRRRTPKKTLAELRNAAQRSKEAKRKYLKRLKKDYVGSSKLNKALEILGKIRGEDPTEKTIIFSQFTSLLDLMEIPLQRGGYKYQRYDGGMKMNERAEAVAQFMDSPDVNIILISLKAGNSGLNLSNSSQVIMLDPFWNPFVEDQAVDRAHRMMQKREVHVHRLLVPNTVEDRILQLQENKRELIGHAMSEGGSGAAGGGLTREELRFLFFGQPNN